MRKATSVTTIAIENAATRYALAVNTVACVNQLRCFGDLVTDLATQATASLRKFHSDYFSCHGATDRMARVFVS